LLPSNTYLFTHWSSMYDGIARCNTILSRIDQVEFSSESVKKRYLAEQSLSAVCSIFIWSENSGLFHLRLRNRHRLRRWVHWRFGLVKRKSTHKLSLI